MLMDSEILNEKKHDIMEKPEALASPEHVSKKKKKRKRKEKDAEAEQQNQQPSQVCSKPLVVATPISVEPSLPDPKNTPKKGKKKKKKNSGLNSEQQQELNKKEDEEKGEVPNETNAQICPPKPSLAIEVPSDTSQVCPTPLVVPISVEANFDNPKDTPKKKKKKRRKKSNLNGEQQELNKEQVPNETNPPIPSLAIGVPEDVEMKIEVLNHDQIQTQPHTPIPVSLIPQTSTVQPVIPIDTEQKRTKRKRRNKKMRSVLDEAQPNEQNIETLVQCSTSICDTPTLSRNQTLDPHPAIPVCPKPVSPIDQTMNTHPSIPHPSIPICPKPVSPIDQTISVVNPTLKICPEPAPLIGQTIPVDPAISMDIEQKLTKSKRQRTKKKMKRVLEVAQPNGHNIEQPETMVQSQTSICHTITPPIDQTMDPHPEIPTCSKPVSPVKQTMDPHPAIPICSKPVSPVKQTMDPHPAIPICSKPVSPIDQTISVVDSALKISPEPAPPIGQTIPVDPAIPMDTDQKLTRSKRKRMKKKMKRVLDGAQPQPNGHNVEQPETLVRSQTSMCHTTTLPIDQTINPLTAIPKCPKPVSLIDQTISVVDPALSIYPEPAPLISQTIPVDPAIPIDTQQKPSMNNRKQNIKQLETPVQKSISPIDQIRAAPPIDPEQRMTKGQGRMSALKIKGSESHEHNADSAAEAPVRGPIGVTVTKVPTDLHNQSSKICWSYSKLKRICWACRKSDHKISQCRMLKSLSKDEEICFFCSEIGHSLGRCSVSLAGGGRFAKCLLCHAYGHFSYNCPGDGHGNYLKKRELEGEGVHC